MRTAKKFCDYCRQPAVYRFSYMGFIAARRNPYNKCWVAACDEHMGCVNWNGMLSAHPEAVVEELRP
jgi:hypothetical protein